MRVGKRAIRPVKPMGPDASPGTLRVMLRLLRETVPGEALPIISGLVLLLGLTGVSLLQPWPLKLVLDGVLGGHQLPSWLTALASVVDRSGYFATHPRYGQLLVLCLGLLVVQLLVGIFNVSSSYVLVSIGLRMVFKLRCSLFDHIQRLSLSFHDATTVGDSLYRVAWDTYCAQTLFNGGIVPAATAAITLIGIAGIMLSVDWVIAVAALLIAVPLIVLIRRMDRPMTERSMHVHERESEVSTRVQETLSGIRAVQAFGREDFESSRFRAHADASLRANLLLTVFQTGSQVVVGLLLAAGTAVVVWIGTVRALSGRLTAGDVVLLIAYVAMLYKPLETLAYTAATIQGATAGARRVFALMDRFSDVADNAGAYPLAGRLNGHLRFDAVSFGYRDRQSVLRDIRLDIPPATTVALVGSSGAGKTTLASLLLRFYQPTHGRILLDGHDLREVTLASLRRNIAFVPQDPVLFSAGIRENIAYSRPDATHEEIEAAARAAGAHEFITALPGGYETEIGERGVMLSGGQRQRLSIARAFLKDAAVLIMDEPTSALDVETETALLRSLDALMRGRTTIIIAHRLSTIRNADRVVVLSDGEIIEQGTHAELLDRPGAFQRLYRLQFGGVQPA